MSFGRYTNIRVQPTTPEVTLQEATALPLQRQKRRDTMNELLAGLDTDVNRTEQDDPFVQEDISQFSKRTEEVANQIASNPNDPNLSRNLFKLQKDINSWKTTGRGFRAQEAFNQFDNAKASYLTNSVKSGFSIEQAENKWGEEQDKLKAEGKWGSIGKDGEQLDYKSNLVFNIPKGVDLNTYVRDTFKEATGHILNEGGGSRITNVGGMLKIVDYKDLNDDNIKSLEAAISYVNAELTDPGSELSKSMAYKGENAEQLMMRAQAMVGMKTTKKESNTSSTRFHNTPEAIPTKKDILDETTLRVEDGAQMNPFDPAEPSLIGLTTTERLDKYYDAVGLTEEQKLKMKNMEKKGFFEKLGDDAASLANFVEILYWNVESDKASYTRDVKINDLQTKIKDRYKDYLTPAEMKDLEKSVGFVKHGENLNSQFYSSEEINNVIDNLQTYYGGAYSNEDLKNMYNNNKASFNNLILEEMKDKATIHNNTYREWGTSPASLRDRAAEQNKYTLGSLDMPTKWYTPSGQETTSDKVMGPDDWTDKSITVTGFSGVGNPTHSAYATRIVVSDKTTGAQSTYYTGDNRLADGIETRVHSAASKIRKSPRNSGELNELLPDSAPSNAKIGYERTVEGYKFYTSDPSTGRRYVQSEGKIKYFQDPLAYLNIYLN